MYMSQTDSEIDHAINLGPISLVARDIDTMLGFYAENFGLKMKTRDDQSVELRASDRSSEPLLILKHNQKAQAAPSDAAGLYHYALLMPDRRSLAATYLSLGKAGLVFNGHADHLVSEALYMTDPEGNGIEFYADRPRDEWKFDEDGKVEMGTLPLDVDSLLGELSSRTEDSLPAISEGTAIGHVHLKVTDLARSIGFYQQLLGLDLMSYWGSAAFLSIGGYHHHIGMNTWESLGGPSRSKGWTGLELLAMRLPEWRVREISARLSDSLFAYSEDLGRLFVSDPDGIELLIEPI
jgi:catechol 2,3-dioxygenase